MRAEMRARVTEFLIATRLLSEVTFRCQERVTDGSRMNASRYNATSLFYICTKTRINRTVIANIVQLLAV